MNSESHHGAILRNWHITWNLLQQQLPSEAGNLEIQGLLFICPLYYWSIHPVCSLELDARLRSNQMSSLAASPFDSPHPMVKKGWYNQPKSRNLQSCSLSLLISLGIFLLQSSLFIGCQLEHGLLWEGLKCVAYTPSSVRHWGFLDLTAQEYTGHSGWGKTEPWVLIVL